jgi:hypothetical protein
MCEGDIHEVADLHLRIMRGNERMAPLRAQAHREYFSKVFLENPWRAEPLRSLVNEEDGKITGFLGVLPRRLTMNGQSLLCAVSSQFIVDPASRHRLTAIKLLKAYFAGPQDVSIADEANHGSRKIWEMMGGQIALLQSMSWLCPLRPMQAALAMSGGRLARALRPVARIGDGVLARFPGNPFRRSAPRLEAETLTPAALAQCMESVRAPLRPVYDAVSAAWLFERGREKNNGEELRRILLRNAAGETAGWYIYCPNRGGVCVLLQMHAAPGYTREVAEHMMHDAFANGGAAVSGRNEAEFLPDLAQHFKALWRPARWMAIHSRRQDVLDAFHRGDAFFSRLDGEWSTHFS